MKTGRCHCEKVILEIIKDDKSLHCYESSPGKVRYYCKNCCSPIFVTVQSQPKFARICLGVLDFEPKVNHDRAV